MQIYRYFILIILYDLNWHKEIEFHLYSKQLDKKERQTSRDKFVTQWIFEAFTVATLTKPQT